MDNKKDLRVTLEESCLDCKGLGMVPMHEENQGDVWYPCLGCEETGYQTLTVSLEELKKLLEGI